MVSQHVPSMPFRMAAAGLLAIAAAAVYLSSVMGMQWVFDDHFSIVENPDVRQQTSVSHLCNVFLHRTPLY